MPVSNHAETFAQADACDAANLLKHDLKSVLNKTLEMALLTDSATLLNVMIRNAPSTQELLMSDIKAALEAYNDEMIDESI